MGGVAGKGLGWISDRRGIPCVTGSRISNAVDYLSGRMLARGIETAGQAFARAQTTVNTTPLGGYTSAVTGNAMDYALGQTAAGGADELAKWIADRQSQMFDVVYVDTGAEVAVHIDHEITIDYEPNGRKLYHARATTASTHSGGLD
jgi:integrating conjugative element protein (TIGR03752 family)